MLERSLETRDGEMLHILLGVTFSYSPGRGIKFISTCIASQLDSISPSRALGTMISPLEGQTNNTHLLYQTDPACKQYR